MKARIIPKQTNKNWGKKQERGTQKSTPTHGQLGEKRLRRRTRRRQEREEEAHTRRLLFTPTLQLHCLSRHLGRDERAGVSVLRVGVRVCPCEEARLWV